MFVLLVVKNGPTLTISSLSHTVIHGETNIARYLARLLTPAYDDGSAASVTEIDSLVDLAAQFVTGSGKERAAVLRTVSGRLTSSNQWLTNGSSFSIADIVMWSAISMHGKACNIPPNVSTWLNSCSTQSAFQTAALLL